MGKLVSVVEIVEGDEPRIRDIEIEPGTTGADIKRQLGLNGYALFTRDSRQIYDDDIVYNLVQDGDKIEVSPLAKVAGKVRILSNWRKGRTNLRRAPSSLNYITRIKPGSCFSRWFQVRRHPRVWEGAYRAMGREYLGRIEEQFYGYFKFYIYKPPKSLLDHPVHGGCVVPTKNKDWFWIHFRKDPKSPEAGIHSIEEFLKDSLIGR